MRLTSLIPLGLAVLLVSCRSPNGRTAGQSMSHRMDNFAKDLGRLLGRESRLTNLSITTNSLIQLDATPRQKSSLSKYLFWDRNFDRLSSLDANSLGRTILMGPDIKAPPGTQGFLSAGSLTDPRLRGSHFSESLKKLVLLDQRFPDLAGWQSVYRD